MTPNVQLMPVSKLWVRAVLLIDFPRCGTHIDAVIDGKSEDFWNLIPDKEYFFHHVHPILSRELLRM